MRAVPRAVSEADGIVERLAREIHPIVVDRYADVDVRIGLGEGIESLEQPAGGEGADYPDMENFLKAARRVAIERRADSAANQRSSRSDRQLSKRYAKGISAG